MTNSKDHIIKVDSDFAKEIGFISDRFDSDSYLWRKNNTILISFIEARVKRMGYFNRLLDQINVKGFDVEVPNPLGIMIRILQHKGFVMTIVKDPTMGRVEVWRRGHSNTS